MMRLIRCFFSASTAMLTLLTVLTFLPMLAFGFSCKGDSRAKKDSRYCLACNFYHEAASMPKKGKKAVGYSVVNRAASRFAGKGSICGQVWAKNQYSWTKMAKHNKVPDGEMKKLLALADEIIAETKHPNKLKQAAKDNPAICATHYHTKRTNIGGMGKYPCWSPYAYDSGPGRNPKCKRQATAKRSMKKLGSPSGDAHLYTRNKGMVCLAEAKGIDVASLHGETSGQSSARVQMASLMPSDLASSQVDVSNPFSTATGHRSDGGPIAGKWLNNERGESK